MMKMKFSQLLFLAATVLATCSVSSAQMIQNMGITKTAIFQQTDATTTSASSAMFQAWVEGDGLTVSYPSAPVSITGPGGTTPLAYEYGGRWLELDYGSTASMDSSYPDGNYNFILNGTNMWLALTPSSYPQTPVCISNAGSWEGGKLKLSAVEAAAGFSLSATETTANGFLSIQLQNESETVELDAYETSPLATSVVLVVSGGELTAGETYTVEVEFDNVVDSENVAYIDSGAWAYALFSSRTTFEIEVVEGGGGTPGGGGSLVHIGGDEFNDNVLDSGWVEWHADPGAFFTETNQRLEYTCPGGGEKFIGWRWDNDSFPVTEDWAVSIDMAHLYNGALTPSQEFVFNLEVGDGTNVVALKYGNYAGSMVMRTEVANFITDQVTYSTGVSVGVSEATVRITYDADLQTLTTAYSTGGAFTDLDTISVITWGLTATSEMTASIMVDNEFLVINAGEVYADNFEILGEVTTVGEEIDDFNDNIINPVKWTELGNGGGAALDEQNSRLELTSPGTADSWVDWQWTLSTLSYTQNWAMELDIGMSVGAAALGSEQVYAALGVQGGSHWFEVDLFQEIDGVDAAVFVIDSGDNDIYGAS